MKYKKIGNSDLEASVIGLGSTHFGARNFIDQKETNRIIHRAFDLGINFIDTAPLYGDGNSETFIKNAIKEKGSGYRSKLILSTKAGLLPTTRKDGTFGNVIAPLDKKYLNSSVEKSLENLGVDYIDLFQLHAFNSETPLKETIGALDELINKGVIRFIGCSNYNSQELKQAWDVCNQYGFKKFVSFQVQYNIIERRAEQEIVPVCNNLGLSLIINRALARGILTGKYKPNQPPPPNSRATLSGRLRHALEEENTLYLADSLDKFAKEREYTGTELAISWLLSKNPNALVLVGIRNPRQLEPVVNSINWNLSQEHITAVDKIIKTNNLMYQVRERPETFFEK